MDISNCNHSDKWTRVPSHLLDIIFDKLKLTKDYLQSGAVCQTWHSILKDNQTKRVTSMPVDKHIPMLLIPNTKNNDDNAWRLFDITINRFFDTKLVVPYSKRFCGSSRGWLAAVNEDLSITLYKPFSTPCQSVSLPRLGPRSSGDSLSSYDYFIDKVLITSDPLTNPDECVVVATSSTLGSIAFIRLNKDSTWTLIKEIGEYGDIYFSDFIHHLDHLFFMSDLGEIYSFDLEDSYNSTLCLLLPKDGIKTKMVKRYIVYLGEGYAIVVRRYFKMENGSNRQKTCNFVLFSVDIDGRNLKPRGLKCIEDRAIFLGDNHSICVEASNFNGCRPNCIYFTDDLNVIHSPEVEETIFDIGVYDIETKNFEFHFNMDSTMFQAMKSIPPIWISPTFNEY